MVLLRKGQDEAYNTVKFSAHICALLSNCSYMCSWEYLLVCPVTRLSYFTSRSGWV